MAKDGGALLRLPGEHEEQVAQAVEVAQDLAVLQEAGALQAHRAPLGPPDQGAGQVDGGSHHRATGDDETRWERTPLLQLGQLGVEPLDHRGRHGREVSLQVGPLSEPGRQLGADREEVALEGQQPLRPLAVALLGTGNAERGDRLVDRSAGFRMGIVLGHATPVEEARLTTVAPAGGDAGDATRPAPGFGHRAATPPARRCRARSSTHLVAAMVAVVASPTAVVTWRVSWLRTSPAAKMPGTLVSMVRGLVT